MPTETRNMVSPASLCPDPDRLCAGVDEGYEVSESHAMSEEVGAMSNSFQELLSALGRVHELEVCSLRQLLEQREVAAPRELASAPTGSPAEESMPLASSESDMRQGAPSPPAAPRPVFKHCRSDTQSLYERLTPHGIQDDVHKAVLTAVSSKVQSACASRSSQVASEYALVRGWRKTPKPEIGPTLRPRRIVRSSRFDGVCAFVIVANAVFLGCITDWAAKSPSPDDWPLAYRVTDRFFSTWFLFELILRFVGLGAYSWLFGSHWRWNLFDAVVVSVDLIETGFSVFTQAESSALQNFTAVRMLRILRIARAIRVVRLLRFCKDLRLIVLAVLRSGTSLFWSIVCLAIIIFIFAIFFMHSVTYYLFECEMDCDENREMADMFGSLVLSCYSLFQAVSGGISWHAVADPLTKVHWSNGIVFTFFVFFTLFAMMNIITGIFVDSAINCAHNDNEEVIQEQMHNENSHMRQLQLLFERLDVRETGMLSLEEFTEQLKNPRVRAQLSILGIDIHEAQGIFKLLDIDKSASVSIVEFVHGCMRMKGLARSLDVISLMYENKRMAQKWLEFFDFVRHEFARHEQFEERVQATLAHALSGTV